MLKRWTLLLAALPLSLLAAEGTETETSGDVIIVEEVTTEDAARVPRPDADRRVPTRGMDMANVRNAFGEPGQEHAAVGDPPITRWDYDGYSVFFEYDKVLHSVVTE